MTSEPFLPITSANIGVLGQGVQGVTITQTDAAGNVSTSSDSLTFEIDTLAPAVDIQSADLTNDSTPTVSGTAETGATVSVVIAGATYSVTASDGTWSVDTSTTPTSGTLAINADGNNSVSVTATDAAGNTSAASTQTLLVDTTAPTAQVTSTTSAGSYAQGDTVNITVTFDEAVTLGGTSPTLSAQLETGTTDRTVALTTADSGLTWTGVYTVQAGDTSSDLTVKALVG